MCGIAGYAGFDGSARLEQMVAAIRHRGPDDEGLVRVGEMAGLGFARLSIVDLSFIDRRRTGVESWEPYAETAWGNSDSSVLRLRNPGETP